MSRSYVVERLFDASPDSLFLSHAEADRLLLWFPPPAAAILAWDVDFRPGGSMTYGFRGDDGPAVWGRCDYTEIHRPWSISMEQSVTDSRGRIISPLSGSQWLLRLRTDILFDNDVGGTLLRMIVSVLDAGQEEQGFFDYFWPRLAQEYRGAMDRLKRSLSTD